MPISPISAVAAEVLQTAPKAAPSAQGGFSETLQQFLGDVNQQLQQADAAEKLLQNGKVQNMEALVYQIEKSDIALKLVTEIRNKALESYQDIMRMQV